MNIKMKGVFFQGIVFLFVLLSGYAVHSTDVLNDASKYIINRVHLILLMASFGAIFIEIFINEQNRSSLKVSSLVIATIIIYKAVEAYIVTTIRFKEQMVINNVALIIVVLLCALVITQIVIAVASKLKELK